MANLEKINNEVTQKVAIVGLMAITINGHLT